MRFKMMACVVAITVAIPAMAQETTTSDSAPKPVKEKKICRREAQTGSILGSPAVCHTKAEWEKIDARNSANADNALSNSRNTQNGGINR
ncbi:MAG: hypothetical protein ACTHJR_09220 [Sphingomonas sp.]|uniref:hypothetical protein n=1 Tax=Sphingomonas sp. TaxID=28214 RepID=UPI003F811516